ncbi:MAG: hypothetical protein AAF604_15395 [Acidobacteriota bacterium]
MKTSVLAAALLLSVLSASASGQLDSDYEIPEDLRGDSSPSEPPQSEDDLRRTRDALYGRSLTDWQHEEVRSWRTENPEWWLGSERGTVALAREQEIAALVRETRVEDLASALDGAEIAYGLTVEHIQPVDGGSLLTSVVISADVAKRPDLFPLSGAIIRFADAYLEADDAERKGYFARLIEPSRDGLSGPELMSLQAELELVLERELEDHAAAFRGAVEVPIVALRADFLGERSVLLDEDSWLQSLSAARRATTDIDDAAARAIVDSLGEPLRSGLLEFLVKWHHSSRVSRVYLTDVGAAQFLEIARQGLALDLPWDGLQ